MSTNMFRQSIAQRVVLAATAFVMHIGMANAADPKTWECDSVIGFTNALKQSRSGDTIKLKPGRYDLSALGSFQDGQNFGTMSKTTNKNDTSGVNCVWFGDKTLTIMGEDASSWSEKTAGQETILDAGRKGAVLYAYGWSGRQSTFLHLTFENGAASSGKDGGGLVATWTANGVVSNCVFRNCTAKNGGGTAYFTPIDCLFENCTATSSGGGVWTDPADASKAAAVGSVFAGCEAADNGGAVAVNADCKILNCTFRNNKTTGEAWKPKFSTGLGGAVYGHCTLENCSFEGNVALLSCGGAIAGTGANRRAKAVNCSFKDNTIGKWLHGDTTFFVDLESCQFTGNGGVAVGTVSRCTFQNVTNVHEKGIASAYYSSNSAYGGGLYVTNSLFARCKADYVIDSEGGTVDCVNVTIADNEVKKSVFGGKAYNGASALSIRNSLISGNVGKDSAAFDLTAVLDETSSIDFSHCLWTEGRALPESGVTVSELIQKKPRFVAGSDRYPDAPYYQLRNPSPAVNKGVNAPWMETALDLDGNPRIKWETVDIGCYECVLEPRGFAVILR